MLCEKCHERNATIHLNWIVGGKMTTRDLCEVCGKEYADPTEFKTRFIPLESLTSGSPAQMLYELIAATDDRFAKEAY